MIPQLLIYFLAVVLLDALLTEFLLNHNFHYHIEYRKFIIHAVKIFKQNFLKLLVLL